MERLDQGHLHPRGPETDMSRPGIEPRPVGSEHSSKELLEKRGNSSLEHLHMSPEHFLLFSGFHILSFSSLSHWQQSLIFCQLIQNLNKCIYFTPTKTLAGVRRGPGGEDWPAGAAGRVQPYDRVPDDRGRQRSGITKNIKIIRNKHKRCQNVDHLGSGHAARLRIRLQWFSQLDEIHQQKDAK